MTVPDYPPGKWSVLLVGAQWVSITSVTALSNAIANRGTIQANFSQLHDTLQQAVTTTLAGQEGETADAIRDAFRQGADQAAQIAEKNGTYKKALQGALDSITHLREKLTQIANEGNQKIDDELKSNDKPDVQVLKIAQYIADGQRQANQAAAECAFSVIGEGQKVVDAQGTGQSFFGMARDAGVEANQQPNLQAIEDQVRGQLNQPAAPGAPARGGNAVPSSEPPPAASAPPAPAPNSSPIPGGRFGDAAPAPGAPAAPAANSGPIAGGRFGDVAPAPGGAFPATPAGMRTGGGGSGIGSIPQMGAPSMGGMPSAGMGGIGGPAGLGAINPAAMGAPPGLNPGAPMSAPAMGGTPGLPGGPVQAMASQVPPTTPTAPTFPTAGAGTPVTVGETPTPTQAPATAVPSSPTPVAYTSESAPPMMSGPAPVAAAPPPPAGPLPAYGSDLVRPTVATPPAPPVIPSAPSAPSAPISGSPTSTVPGSASVHPSAGGTPGVSQPTTVVRQPGSPTPAQAPPGVGTEGAIASAGGALAGAVSAEATARKRLQRIVAAVANQQPRLAWAVGDRADDTTVLVTDLASGWIPPGIEIPAAVTLLEPARRRGDIEALLGEVKLAAATQAEHYRPESDTDEPVPTSPRPRHAPEVEDLNWRLNRATLYRDGLTRLAHTLATAASKNTGVLESEAEDLHNQLTALADRVLDSYPDHVDAAELGNWQLLAAIEALVNGDKTAANYHLAWFLTCNTAAAESFVQ
jgi:hypothetical protein